MCHRRTSDHHVSHPAMSIAGLLHFHPNLQLASVMSRVLNMQLIPKEFWV